MQFGKLEYIEEDRHFTLPPSHPLNAKILPQQPAKEPKVFVGCSVWTEKGYKGRIIPAKTPQRLYLQEYAKQLPTVEMNGTHYYLPRPEVVESWLAAVPEGFRFCPKVPQFISHRRNMLGNPEMTEQFLLITQRMAKHLGPCILQMPPYFGPDRLHDLAAFLEYWPSDVEIALELRHPAWFKDATAQNEVFALMEACGVHAVISDVGGRRDALHMRLSSKKLLLRFNGHNLHRSDYERLNDWAALLHQWLEAGLEEAYIFMHQPEQAFGAELVRHFIQQMNRLKPQLKLKEPQWYGGGLGFEG